MSTFSWELVPTDVIRGMLIQGYREKDGWATGVGEIRQMSKDALTVNADRRFGTPPAKRHFDAGLVRTLREDWLPVASDEVIQDLAAEIALVTRARGSRQTHEDRLTYLWSRRLTTNVCAAFHKQFRRAYRVPRERGAGDRPEKPSIESFRRLIGQGAPATYDWYDHQVEAHKRMDRLWTSRKGRARGTLVLPTGSGKTDTMAGWLLEQLAEDNELRVLWLVHQRELVEQAMSRFEALATRQQPGFERVARSVYSGASPVSTLTDESVSVIVATFQSFRQMNRARRHLVRYFSRPTIVVVDEAHHAGARTYEDLLTAVEDQENVRALFGLTATPYLSGRRRHLYVTRFGDTPILQVPLGELIRKGILARPITTTHRTGHTVDLTDELVERWKGSTDIPVEILVDLDTAHRNALVVQAWLEQRERWGKTLVFATSIAHADRLAKRFDAAGVPVRALHSAIEDRAAPLKWFRDHADDEGVVLVSVGMLTEGVDIPDAHTAFLARPTTSPILMRQMVGRVLRGPRAGGGAIAYVVHFRDDWRSVPDILHPEHVLPYAVTAPAEGLPRVEELPPLVTDEDLLLQQELARQIERWRAEFDHFFDPSGGAIGTVPFQIGVSDAEIVGYYGVHDELYPVLNTQRDVLDVLLRDVAAGKRVSVERALIRFEEVPLPHPPEHVLAALMREARDSGEAPELEAVEGMRASPRDVAVAIRAAGSLTDDQRSKWISDAYDGAMTRALYPTLGHFDTAVNDHLRRLRDEQPRVDPEEAIRQTDDDDRPLLPHVARDLAAIHKTVLTQAARLLPPELRAALSTAPESAWTRNVLTHAFAYYATKRTRGDFVPRIMVNRLLQTSQEHVPDETLAFLIYHEVLHHVLPFNGHDDEFRRYEDMWPDAAQHEMLLDTLQDRWEMRPEKYRGTVEP